MSRFVQERKGSISERYEVQSTIGKGAYGEVRVVVEKESLAVRAMKVIKKEKCADVSPMTLLNEIEVLKRLDHPNIIKIFEFSQDESNYYIITEYCSGGELFDRIIRLKHFSELDAARLAKQILLAIAYCHAVKVVHRYSLFYAAGTSSPRTCSSSPRPPTPT